jgi:hypothetical protein
LKAQISLTPAESRRLIAKAVKEHPLVKKALGRGIVAIALGSTNSYVVEEILGKKLEKERYIAGYIDEIRGACVVPKSERLSEVILKNGKVIDKRIDEAVEEMGPRDVMIKGANAVDFNGVAAVMMASKLGGTIAKVLGIIKAKGVKLIIPVGLEKLVPHSLNNSSNMAGIYEMDYSDGVPVGLMPFTGELLTEIEAFRILSGTEAVNIASGGVGGNTSRTFIVIGKEEDVNKAIEIIKSIKGETPIKPIRGDCRACEYNHCPNNKKEQ